MVVKMRGRNLIKKRVGRLSNRIGVDDVVGSGSEIGGGQLSCLVRFLCPTGLLSDDIA